MTLPWQSYIRPSRPRPSWGVGAPAEDGSGWTQSGPKGNTQYSNPDSQYKGPTATADAIKAAGDAFVQKVGGLLDVIVQLVAANPGDATLTKVGVDVQALLDKAQTYVAQGSSTAALESEFNTAKSQISTWKVLHTTQPTPPLAAPPPPAAPPPAAPHAAAPPPAPMAPAPAAPIAPAAKASWFSSITKKDALYAGLGLVAVGGVAVATGAIKLK